VILIEDGQVTGIVTDRDIAVRAVAEGLVAESTAVSEISTTGIKAVEPDASVDNALRTMREEDIRRVPVVRNGRPVGIVSLGDLAVEREPDSTLADISAAAPDQ
jgi:CBS domain-containing protein